MRTKTTSPYPIGNAAFVALVLVALAAPFSAVASPQHEAEGGRLGETAEATRAISVTAKDIGFDKQRIDVRDGETVRFVIANVGDLIHEFTIGTAYTQNSHRRMMMEMMQGMASEEGGPDQSLHREPNTVELGPGETRELAWRFSRAENLEFACNVPGHYESGMMGVFQFTR